MQKTETKTCAKCKRDLELDQFYKDKRSSSGFRSYCKSCGIENANTWHKNNPKRLNMARIKWKKNNRTKLLAHQKVQRAVRNGKVQKPSLCEKCGCPCKSLHGHHDDYSRPLDVIWLCPSCHKFLHAALNRKPKMRYRIYISGPISIGDRDSNFNQAEEAHLSLARAGFAPLNPMLTMKLKFAFDGTFEHEDWMEMDIPWLLCADAVLRLPGDSVGADMEVEAAKEADIPVFLSVYEIIWYFAKETEGCVK